MPQRVAFIGLRHNHGLGMYKHMLEHPDFQVVAICEEHAETREALARDGIEATHTSYAEMLEAVDCDIVATADYYGIRGERLIAALEAGRHVIADKPLCTSLDELRRMRKLAEANDLKVGCMLDMAGSARMVTLKRLFDEGRIGEVHAVDFCGQHPLLYGSRPMWYFEQGKHGGTINDIAIHAVDAIPWLTGRRFARATAARVWHVAPSRQPAFQTGAMAMLELDNGGGVLGDVSYLVSDAHGYSIPSYWRMTFYGDIATAEANSAGEVVHLWPHQGEAEDVPATGAVAMRYLKEFLADVEGEPVADGLHTARVLESTRIALRIQEAADTKRFDVDLTN